MSHIGLDVLSQYFHLPINSVAKELGVCATVLKVWVIALCSRYSILIKKMCRKYAGETAFQGTPTLSISIPFTSLPDGPTARLKAWTKWLVTNSQNLNYEIDRLCSDSRGQSTKNRWRPRYCVTLVLNGFFFFLLFKLLNSQTALRMKLQTSRTKNVFWYKIQMCLVRSLLVSHVLLLTVFLLFDRQLRQERKQTTLLKESGKG